MMNYFAPFISLINAIPKATKIILKDINKIIILFFIFIY
jgi:hypothetical protein